MIMSNMPSTIESSNPVVDEGVEYFENGCLCYLSGKISKGDSFEYYYDNCTCTRHPESANRLCWDKDKHARQAALEIIKKQHSHWFD